MTAQLVAMTNAPTVPGWYAIGFRDEADEVQWGPIYRFDGEAWFDDDDEEVTSLWDPLLQEHVAMNAADGYVRQGG